MRPPAAESCSPLQRLRGRRLEEEQAAKVSTLQPYTSGKVEQIFRRVDTILEGGTLRWHPFFDSAYNGGGFTLGVGRATYVSAYNYVDVRGSYSMLDYKRAEAEFIAPRLFNRRAQLSVIGGWREATQVGFFGTGTDTSIDDRTNYLFQQPYGSALFTIFPTRKVLMLRGGVEFTQWAQKPGEGAFPSVEERYTPATLPGLGATVNYLHTQGTIGLDWRTSREYSRRGAFLRATLHDYKDGDDAFGFQMAEYEGIAQSETTTIAAPAGLPSTGFVAVDIAADSATYLAWSRPVRAYFSRNGENWKLVGFEPPPDRPATARAAETTSQ